MTVWRFFSFARQLLTILQHVGDQDQEWGALICITVIIQLITERLACLPLICSNRIFSRMFKNLHQFHEFALYLFATGMLGLLVLNSPMAQCLCFLIGCKHKDFEAVFPFALSVQSQQTVSLLSILRVCLCPDWFLLDQSLLSNILKRKLNSSIYPAERRCQFWSDLMYVVDGWAIKESAWCQHQLIFFLRSMKLLPGSRRPGILLFSHFSRL